MKLISRQRLKETLHRLLHGDDGADAETKPVWYPAPVALDISHEEIENKAQITASYGMPEPWLKNWAASAPDEVLSFNRDLWKARSLGVETPELKQWQERFTALAARFFEQPGNRNAIIETEFLHEGKGLYYKDRNNIHYRLPDALQSAFPDVAAAHPIASVSLPPAGSYGACAPA